MSNKTSKQRKITKPNSINMANHLDIEDSIHGEDSPLSLVSEVVDLDPMDYNKSLLEEDIPSLEFIKIPAGKLLVRFFKRPRTTSNLEVVKTKTLITDSGRERSILDGSSEATYIPRFVVVKIGSENVNTVDIEVGDILDGLPIVNYVQYYCPLHKEQLGGNENFYLIPDTHYSFIWKTKHLPVEQRVQTALIP